MDFGNVIRLMGQQLNALKNIEDLLAHDEKQNPADRTVKPEDIENLKNYVATMKQAAETAKALAEYYQKLEKPAKAAEGEKAAPENKDEPTGKPEESKPKRSSSRKKTEPPAQPAQPAEPENPPEPAAEPVAATVPTAPPASAEETPPAAPETPTDINALLAALTIDNLQS